MKIATKPTVKTLGEYAYQAIQKYFSKTLKYEKTVKKDEDPEALHQMRVGMRRLRTAVSRFDLVLNLPKPASDKNIGKIARRLGSLRDLDVLKENLENLYQPKLPNKENKSLHKVFNALAEQREAALADVLNTLKDDPYKSFKQTLEEWLEKPSHQSLASLPIQQVLPDLLLPEVSIFFLHPGWLVGTQIVESEVQIRSDWKAEKIEQHLTSKGDTIHDLRKQAKRMRYQMELFADLYPESYATYLAEIKSIQDILGSIQDSVVMGEWLTDIFKSEFNTHLPTLANLLAENRYQLWHQWQPLQEKYLMVENRHNFRLAILQSV
ncbi:CHAD domain-containing protein [Nostoc cycadae]|uniref:CHAD domain-containing protein n=1 Tax=Nostoc cycadae WK-1 TaxID=1861711 RepID=A0A2H6LBC7_9NOSO|nr:CHAD domain-containing protein [Nostoc cycadae]GBE90446.1 CHAD domain-containing protein [Nostoc cycadae WK-1]